MFQDADDVSFRKILYNKTYVLHTYLPKRPVIVYSLRSKNTLNLLLRFTTDLNDCHFLITALYKDCY